MDGALGGQGSKLPARIPSMVRGIAASPGLERHGPDVCVIRLVANSGVRPVIASRDDLADYIEHPEQSPCAGWRLSLWARA
ncbi:MAG: hypothetical protein ACLTXI_12310 [Collinsella sp.]